jgi:hypothetical protein
MTGGSLRTAEFCRKHGKPYWHVNLEGMWPPRAVYFIEEWLESEFSTTRFIISPESARLGKRAAEAPCCCLPNSALHKDQSAI